MILRILIRRIALPVLAIWTLSTAAVAKGNSSEAGPPGIGLLGVSAADPIKSKKVDTAKLTSSEPEPLSAGADAVPQLGGRFRTAQFLPPAAWIAGSAPARMDIVQFEADRRRDQEAERLQREHYLNTIRFPLALWGLQYSAPILGYRGQP